MLNWLPPWLHDALKTAALMPRQLRGEYVPHHPKPLGREALVARLGELSGFAAVPLDDLYDRHREHSRRHGYAGRLGKRHTLTGEEAFVLCALIASREPPVVVEIGTQLGKSTRRILDMRDLLGLDYRVECFDIVDEVRFFDRSEARLHVEDVTGRVAETLARYGAGVIFLDARPRDLIEEVLAAVLDDQVGDWALAIHDCGRGLCNPAMGAIPAERIGTHTGVWERHVVAACFGKSPFSSDLHGARSGRHLLGLLETRHGLGLVVHG
jgi:hypothetical protein